MMLSVGKVAKMFGISRTTLLYYEKIGLLIPEARSESEYRLYSQADVTRLEQIITLKNAGVPVKQIQSLIATDETVIFGKLLKRLGEFNLEILKIKNYQKEIISILSRTFSGNSVRNEDLKTIDEIISYSEINLDNKDGWHMAFESQSPELHKHFLSVLELSEDEIKTLIKRIK